MRERTEQKTDQKDVHELEREMAVTRLDLAEAVGELSDTIRAKLDVKARARGALHRGYVRGEALACQGAAAAKTGLDRAKTEVQRDPRRYALIGGGALGGVIGLLLLGSWRKSRRSRRLEPYVRQF